MQREIQAVLLAQDCVPQRQHVRQVELLGEQHRDPPQSEHLRYKTELLHQMLMQRGVMSAQQIFQPQQSAPDTRGGVVERHAEVIAQVGH